MKDYLKLLRFLRPHVWLFFAAFVCTSVSAALNGITLLSILPFIDIVFTQKKIVLPTTLPSVFSSLIDRLNSTDPETVFNIMLIVIIPFFLLKNLFFWLQGYLMNSVSLRAVMDVRNRLFEKIQQLSLDFYSEKRTGELMSRIINDVGRINYAISFAFRDLVHELLRFLIYLFFVLAVGGKMSLVTLILLPLIIAPATRIGKKLKKISTQTQEKIADITSLLSETISGVRIVKAFSMEDYEIGRFKAQNRDYFRFLLKATKRNLLSSPISEFAGAIAATLVLFLWGREVVQGNISFGAFGLVMGSLMSLMQPLKKLTDVHFITQEGLAASKRIYAILEEEPSVKEVPQALSISGLKKTLAFEGVWFKYEETSDYVLKDINLEVKAGQIIAIVGPSGTGKTSLVNLIPRFYDPQKGKVLFDGTDISKCTLKSLRRLIGIVTQEMVLFNDTVRANIVYGNMEASQESIKVAARRALAEDFISKLPEGYDTIIGDRGFKLSGGEKQRIAIARAILKDAPILILDEATSQLDSQSESLVQAALNNLMQGKTVFVIAHRLSTVKNASKILVIQDGKIAQTGSHEELLKNSDLYHKLYQLQFNM
ncbi:MAG: ABC transporter ATP-binding protein [Candidatus Omnitrophica bacterium]|nr:ABC transporter ATP-binding protein [Candidatus Omnitrophota bacterium]